jgi:hypothetical protein
MSHKLTSFPSAVDCVLVLVACLPECPAFLLVPELPSAAWRVSGVGQVADLGGIVARVDRILHEKAKRSDVSSLDPRLLLGWEKVNSCFTWIKSAADFLSLGFLQRQKPKKVWKLELHFLGSLNVGAGEE